MADPLERRGKTGFMFVCDQTTEAECLEKQLVGTTQANAIWCMSVKEGDDIYLLNFNTGVVRGPYAAVSRADCHDPGAWGGKFPIQVEVCKTAATRRADNHDPSAPVATRKRHPSGPLDAAADTLYKWLLTTGTPIA
jgi:hypothetical protein